MESTRPRLVLNPPPNIKRVLCTQDVDELVEFLENNLEVGFDVETTPVKDFYWRRLRTIQFGTKDKQFVIDLKAFCGNTIQNASELLYDCQGEYGKHLHKAPQLHALMHRLAPFLCSDKYLKVGVNLQFEYEQLYWLTGMRTYGYYCCMLAEKCIYAGLGGKASLKNYSFYSMDEMVDRYFHASIDKELQTSFNLEDELTDSHYEYAALDTRTPLGIKYVQSLIASGKTVKDLESKGKFPAEYLRRVDPAVLGDNLNDIIKLENDALGAFGDMYIHGENFDSEKWLARVAEEKEEFKTLLTKLDEYFLPLVGSKHDVASDAIIEAAEAEWKTYNIPTAEEVALKPLIRSAAKQQQGLLYQELVSSLAELEKARKAKKEELKAACSDLKKKRTKAKNLFEKCEGEALINYGSDAQLLHALHEHDPKQFKKIEGLDEEAFETYDHIPIIKLIGQYHVLAKKIETYGDSWGQQWKTHPCLDEGWLHPGDGRLHSKFNQYDAETGRTSSEQPNGQNLPKDKEVRACFISDAPDEGLRISVCCNALTQNHGIAIAPQVDISSEKVALWCMKCGMPCQTEAADMSTITIDMSGAELRILAEEANEPIWIKAFANDEDVHSECSEMVEGEVYWKEIAEPDCAYFKVKENGQPARVKCKCKLHNEIRDGMKPTNFGLPYGIGPRKLSKQIGKSYKYVCELLAKHKAAFPTLWAYLEKSGNEAKIFKKAVDMFGRRRIFPEPTWERATEYAKEDLKKKLELPEEEAKKNLSVFEQIHKRKPAPNEKWLLTHRNPNNKEISKAFQGLFGSIERQGKNHKIQSANASIIKLAMGAGYSPDGQPYLWHIFPKYRAKLQKMVHDELGVSVPTIYAEELAKLIQDAIRRAAAEAMKLVVMESDYRVAKYWMK
jgi:DNA polymerase I-like protein with 3'-5' exonuclease and polymerase domains